MAYEYVLNEACCLNCGTPGSTGCQCGHDEQNDELPSAEEDDMASEEKLDLDLYVENHRHDDETPAQARFRQQREQEEAAANRAVAKSLGRGFGAEPEEMTPWTPQTLVRNSAELEVMDLDAVRDDEEAEHQAHIRKLRRLRLLK